MVNEIGLWRLIDECIRREGLAKDEVDIQACHEDIMSYHQTIEPEQNIYVLVNSELDIPYTAQVLLISGNNTPETSKSDYEKLVYAQYQFFKERITVQTRNYGIDFIPYRPEFIRIVPNKIVKS
jgi:hypothetical protein